MKSKIQHFPRLNTIKKFFSSLSRGVVSGLLELISQWEKANLDNELASFDCHWCSPPQRVESDFLGESVDPVFTIFTFSVGHFLFSKLIGFLSLQLVAGAPSVPAQYRPARRNSRASNESDPLLSVQQRKWLPRRTGCCTCCSLYCRLRLVSSQHRYKRIMWNRVAMLAPTRRATACSPRIVSESAESTWPFAWRVFIMDRVAGSGPTLSRTMLAPATTSIRHRCGISVCGTDCRWPAERSLSRPSTPSFNPRKTRQWGHHSRDLLVVHPVISLLFVNALSLAIEDFLQQFMVKSFSPIPVRLKCNHDNELLKSIYHRDVTRRIIWFDLFISVSSPSSAGLINNNAVNATGITEQERYESPILENVSTNTAERKPSSTVVMSPTTIKTPISDATSLSSYLPSPDENHPLSDSGLGKNNLSFADPFPDGLIVAISDSAAVNQVNQQKGESTSDISY